MADEVDARQIPEEEDVKTAVETKRTRKDGIIIKWSKLEEELRLAHNKKIENSPKPSMWEYNPKGGVPTELANLDPSTFLTSRHGLIFCFLPKSVFARICSLLSVCDFVHLSLTCRFLHWRMFTFCTCYAPYNVHMHVHDDRISPWGRKTVSPMLTYTLNNDDIDNKKDGSMNGDPVEAAIRRLKQLQVGERGLFIHQPFCLRKPFVFETLDLKLLLPFYCKTFYDMCLPYILALRGLARHLNIIFVDLIDFYPERVLFNFSDTNDFLTAINASYYSNIDWYYTAAGKTYQTNNMDIYMNCPYARQMYRVFIVNRHRLDIIEVPVFQNIIGVYAGPLDSAIIATLKTFLADSTGLIFHQYLNIEKDNGRFPLIEYLFEEFGDFEELFSAEMEQINHPYLLYYIWMKVITTANGGRLRIVIRKLADERTACVRIGKEEVFDEMDKKYTGLPLYREGSIWWKIETAVEPDEVEEPKVTVESDLAKDPYGAMQSDKVEGPCVSVEPVVVVKPKVLLEPDEVEEDREESGVCLCLNNTLCSIQ